MEQQTVKIIKCDRCMRGIRCDRSEDSLPTISVSFGGGIVDRTYRMCVACAERVADILDGKVLARDW